MKEPTIPLKIQEEWTLSFSNEMNDFDRMNSDFVTKANVMLETINRDSKSLTDLLLDLGELSQDALTSFVNMEQSVGEAIDK